MTEFAKMILDRIGEWPKAAQEELIQAIVEIEAKHFGVYHLSDEERAAVREGLAQAERGEFASDEEVSAFFNRYRI
jgi:predicted transcriptional regulator